MTSEWVTVTVDEGGDGRDPAPGATSALVVVLEGDRPAARSSRHDLTGVAEVVIGRAHERQGRRTGPADARVLTIGVPDRRMSQQHVRLVRELDRWVLEDTGSKNGVVMNGGKVQRVLLGDGDTFELGHTVFMLRHRLTARSVSWPEDLEADELAPPAPGLATFVPELARDFQDLARVVAARVPILVQGESGTGKELLARAVHHLGGGGRLVAVNCGALPGTLVESELFGYKKGAFSGATQDRLGLVRSADGGTLFLDEIGDLSLASQAALLRVLQEREVTPLGASEPVPVTIRLVAASHQNLEQLVADDRFRRDLYSRLAGFTLRLPPLRERREDLGLLVAALMSRVAERAAGLEANGEVEPGAELCFSPEAVQALVRHDWPLNVRELEACLQVAGALATGGVIRLEHLPATVRGEGGADGPGATATATAAAAAAGSASPRRGAAGSSPGSPAVSSGGPAGDNAGESATSLSPEDQAQRDHLVAMLTEHRGNVSAVARAAGKARIQIHRWLKRYRLDPADFRR